MACSGRARPGGRTETDLRAGLEWSMVRVCGGDEREIGQYPSGRVPDESLARASIRPRVASLALPLRELRPEDRSDDDGIW